jgi:hypothetical protein
MAGLLQAETHPGEYYPLLNDPSTGITGSPVRRQHLRKNDLYMRALFAFDIVPAIEIPA